jgi:hypothetical protein
MFNIANKTDDMINGWRMLYTNWHYVRLDNARWFQVRLSDTMMYVIATNAILK